jgi:hypothetical protein
MRLWELPKIKGFILKYLVPLVWPTYICARRITFSKACGIKMTCYWELFGKHVKKLKLFALTPSPAEPRPQDKKGSPFNP